MALFHYYGAKSTSAVNFKMAVVIILKNYYFRIIIKSLTKCNVLSTFTLKNYGKFTDHNLEKLCPRSLALASIIAVLSFERVCPRKVGPLLRIFFKSLVLASNVVSSTPPLPIMEKLSENSPDCFEEIIKKLSVRTENKN